MGGSVPGVGGTTLLVDTAEAAGVTGVVGAWEEELSLGAPPDEGVAAAADWLRELRRRSTEVRELFSQLILVPLPPAGLEAQQTPHSL